MIHRRLRDWFAVLSIGLAASSTRGAPGMISREQIIADADKTAVAQVQGLKGKSPIDWTGGVMYAGFADYSHVSQDMTSAHAVAAAGAESRWTPLSRPKDAFHADDFCIGQAFLDAAVTAKDESIEAPLKDRLNGLVEHLNAEGATPKQLTWWWCDALFMAPPVMARMSLISQDRKYLDAMDQEWWRTTKLLYDEDEHLFYRDAKAMKQKTKSGQKVFWSRGNGWVIAGLARVLKWMPEDYPDRARFVELFQRMAARLLLLQGKDGTWTASLLDAAEFPSPECSGTALDCYAMAWGINNGLLDREKYLPAVTRAWVAVISHRREDGLPGYVQGVGSGPGATQPQGTQHYATGQLLMAATELVRLAPLSIAASEEVEAAPPTQPAGILPPAPAAKAYARYVPERMDDIAWENDRIAHRIYGPALQNNPKEHSGSGIDVWAKSVRRLVINDWYRNNDYHKDHGTGLDFYEVGLSRGDGGLGIWSADKLYVSRDWIDYKILDRGPDECGFQISYAPWDANGRKVWEHRTETLKAGSNLDRLESTIDSDKPGDLIVGVGLASRPGEGAKLLEDKEHGVFSYWQPPEKEGTIGVGVLVDPSMIVGFTKDPLNNLVLLKVTAGKPFVYYAGACWTGSGDFKTPQEWEKYLREFQRSN